MVKHCLDVQQICSDYNSVRHKKVYSEVKKKSEIWMQKYKE